MYAYDWILSGKSEEDLRVKVGWFFEACRSRGLKFNAGKRKVMVMNVEEGSKCEVHIYGIL